MSSSASLRQEPFTKRKILLVMSFSLGYERQQAVGFARFLREHLGWRVQRMVGGAALASETATYDGAIGLLTRRDIIGHAVRVAKHVVNTSATLLSPEIPTVLSDDRAVGEMAAKYFLERGYEHLAFVGLMQHGAAIRREEGFRKTVQAAGANYILPGPSQRDDMEEWLKHLPKPCAIFCFADDTGLAVMNAAAAAGVSVPDEVSVLGVNNDEALCNLCPLPLSSIVLPTVEIGYRACVLLDELMSGKTPGQTQFMLPPVEIVTRHSTDIYALENDAVTRALRLIREHAHEGLTVEELVNRLRVARRTLERHFKRLLDRSPYDEIQRVRLEYARRLLRETQWRVEEVAERSGFGEARTMNQTFRELTGQTPTEYRRAMLGRG